METLDNTDLMDIKPIRSVNIALGTPKLPCQSCNPTSDTNSTHPCTCGNTTNSPIIHRFPSPNMPTADDTIIRAPFTSVPGREDITFPLLKSNPCWFLHVEDFTGPNGIKYPASLYPPRGQLAEGDSLRCTFCRKDYGGRNAKSMWKRHLLTKHRVPTGIPRRSNKSVSASVSGTGNQSDASESGTDFTSSAPVAGPSASTSQPIEVNGGIHSHTPELVPDSFSGNLSESVSESRPGPLPNAALSSTVPPVALRYPFTSASFENLPPITNNLATPTNPSSSALITSPVYQHRILQYSKPTPTTSDTPVPNPPTQPHLDHIKTLEMSWVPSGLESGNSPSPIVKAESPTIADVDNDLEQTYPESVSGSEENVENALDSETSATETQLPATTTRPSASRQHSTTKSGYESDLTELDESEAEGRLKSIKIKIPPYSTPDPVLYKPRPLAPKPVLSDSPSTTKHMRMDDPDVPANYRQCTCKPCKHALPPLEEYAYKYCEPCRTRYRVYQAERAARRRAENPLAAGAESDFVQPNLRQKQSRKAKSDSEDAQPTPKRLRTYKILPDGREDIGSEAPAVPSPDHKLTGRERHLQRMARRPLKISKPGITYPTYVHHSDLVESFVLRLKGFVVAREQYIQHKGGDGAASFVFSFTGEFSAVAPSPKPDAVPGADQQDAQVRAYVMIQLLGSASGLTFAPGGAFSVPSWGGILVRATCSSALPSPAELEDPVAPESRPDASKAPEPSIAGEMEVAVMPDPSHRYFKGERTIVRFRLWS